MSRRDGDKFIIEPEPPAACELCGAIAELRPYGPNGERICFACGMKDEELTLKKFAAEIEGASAIHIKLPPTES
jgi:hypothetical protein